MTLKKTTGSKPAEPCAHCHEPLTGKQHCPKNPDCHWQLCDACEYMNDLTAKKAWKP